MVDANREISQTARNLQLALAEAYAPRIGDPEAMRIAKGLRDGVSEGKLNLNDVPINVVYSAMLNFTKLQQNDKIELKHIRKLEGLHASLDLATNRKRKSLSIYPDEFPAMRDALKAALDIVNPIK